MSFRNEHLPRLTTALQRFLDHRMIDWGAALTFYAAISLIPALVILVGLIGLIGDDVINELAEHLRDAKPGPARALALDVIEEVRTSTLGAGVALVIGVGGTLWTASSYVGCFLRASGVIHESAIRHPFWRLRPLQMVITGGVIIAIAAVALAVVASGPLAQELAGIVGLETVVAEIWDLAKWPGIVVLVMTIFAVLYWAGPDTRERGFRWITPGGVVAALAWAAGSAGYALYVASFPAYNKVYGSLGAVVGFLGWLWLSNMAMLFGAELNAVIEEEGADQEARESEPPGKGLEEARSSSNASPGASA